MKLLTTCYLLLLATIVNAKEYKHDFNFPDYKNAEVASSYLKFEMESTKAGIITTSFIGLARQFHIEIDYNTEFVKKTKISFPILLLDTDNKARDEKMHETCFDSKSHDLLVVEFDQNILVGGDSKIIGTILIRGLKKPIQVALNTKLEGGQLLVKGSSNVLLSELGIPDPSIWIASVRDRVDITFDVAIPIN